MEKMSPSAADPDSEKDLSIKKKKKPVDRKKLESALEAGKSASKIENLGQGIASAGDSIAKVIADKYKKKS